LQISIDRSIALFQVQSTNRLHYFDPKLQYELKMELNHSAKNMNRQVENPTRASIFVEKDDVIELDRIRAIRGISRNSAIRQAIAQYIAAQQNAA
jgi:hypothetical protein